MDNSDLIADENSAQQSIALRRELRRKKILEASKSRLDKLNGRASAIQKENIGNTSYFMHIVCTLYLLSYITHM